MPRRVSVTVAPTAASDVLDFDAWLLAYGHAVLALEALPGGLLAPGDTADVASPAPSAPRAPRAPDIQPRPQRPAAA